MARCVLGERGGIFGLVRLLEEFGEAVEYDLIALGLRRDWLGTERLSWRDLLVIVKGSPRTSALARAQHGEAALWGIAEYLLANAVDALHDANWQRAGKKSAKKPKRIPRPGRKDTQKIGKDALPISELEAWISEAEAALEDVEEV